MRSIESSHADLNLGEQITEGIKGVLGPQVAFHYTVQHPQYQMTFGGLHETQEGAINAREKLVDKAGRARYTVRTGGAGLVSPRQIAEEEKRLLEEAVREWEEAPIIEIQVDEVYHPSSGQFFEYTHGVDDGTHGSKEEKWW